MKKLNRPNLNEWIRTLLSQGFVWMALSGLFLVGWGLLVTPDEMQGGNELSNLSWKGSLEKSGDQGSEYAWK